MIRLPVILGLVSSEKMQKWIRRYDEAFLKFPGGFTDWEAFGVLIAILLIPVIVFSVKYKVDIFSNSLYFFGVSAIIIIFCYYWIYFRSIDFLKKSIQGRSKRFYA